MTDSLVQIDLREDIPDIIKNYQDLIELRFGDSHYPAIYINTTDKILIENGILYINDSAVLGLVGRTMLDVVNVLRQNGVPAYLTRAQVALQPAMTLANFRNHSVFQREIDKSPTKLSSLIDDSIKFLATTSMSPVNISILNVFSNIDGEYVENEFDVDSNNIFVHNISTQTIATVELFMEETLIFAMDSNAIDISEYFRKLPEKDVVGKYIAKQTFNRNVNKL